VVEAAVLMGWQCVLGAWVLRFFGRCSDGQK
jgi:hypothetical protein